MLLDSLVVVLKKVIDIFFFLILHIFGSENTAVIVFDVVVS